MASTQKTPRPVRRKAGTPTREQPSGRLVRSSGTRRIRVLMPNGMRIGVMLDKKGIHRVLNTRSRCFGRGANLAVFNGWLFDLDERLQVLSRGGLSSRKRYTPRDIVRLGQQKYSKSSGRWGLRRHAMFRGRRDGHVLHGGDAVPHGLAEELPRVLQRLLLGGQLAQAPMETKSGEAEHEAAQRAIRPSNVPPTDWVGFVLLHVEHFECRAVHERGTRNAPSTCSG